MSGLLTKHELEQLCNITREPVSFGRAVQATIQPTPTLWYIHEPEEFVSVKETAMQAEAAGLTVSHYCKVNP